MKLAINVYIKSSILTINIFLFPTNIIRAIYIMIDIANIYLWSEEWECRTLIS